MWERISKEDTDGASEREGPWYEGHAAVIDREAQGVEQPGRASHGTQEVCSGEKQGRARCGGLWCVEGEHQEREWRACV